MASETVTGILGGKDWMTIGRKGVRGKNESNMVNGDVRSNVRTDNSCCLFAWS